MKFCDANFWFKILNSEIYMQKWLNYTIYSFYYSFCHFNEEGITTKSTKLVFNKYCKYIELNGKNNSISISNKLSK